MGGSRNLFLLAFQALRSARRGEYGTALGAGAMAPGRAALLGWRQGFISNVTNPKVLAFHLAVLPQFLPVGESPLQAVPLALTHAVISALYLALIVFGIQRARRLLARRRVRRWMDRLTGAAMLGLGVRLGTEAL